MVTLLYGIGILILSVVGLLFLELLREASNGAGSLLTQFFIAITPRSENQINQDLDNFLKKGDDE